MKKTYEQLVIDMRRIGFRESKDNEIYTLKIILNNCRESAFYFIETDDAFSERDNLKLNEVEG